MKKIILTLLMMQPLVAIADPIVIDGIFYNLVNKAKEAVVTHGVWEIYGGDYEGRYSGNVTIPEKIVYEGEEYNVTSIDDAAFMGCADLTSVNIPNSIISIGQNAFTYCSGLTSITIPNSVTSLGHAAFQCCTALTSFVIPNSVTSISSTFLGCTNLSSVTIPNSVTSFGFMTFSKCPSLTSIDIPNSVTTIGEGAFSECGLTSITIPNSVTSIGQSAFWSCRNLKTISIGNRVKSIDYKAFSNCTELLDIYCYAESIPITESNVFEGSYPECITLHVPWGTVEKYKTSTPWSGLKEILALTYKLTYNVDGEIYKEYDIKPGAAISPEPTPSREGYTFSGWSDIPATMPANDVTVTGSFSINKYQLMYMVDGAEYKKYDVEYGAAITPEPIPSKEGYTFSGWSDIPATMPANDVTVTGSFSINKYQLMYMVDGAEYKKYDVEYGATITPEPEPQKDGYTFSGWSEIPKTMPANNVTVTGTFVQNPENYYTLKYIVDGTTYKTYQLQAGAAIIPEPAPSKEGYTFSGWSDIPATMPANDVTVTGKFTINKYKLIYKVDGAEYKKYEVEYGATITPEPEPTKDGYTFSGWSDIPKTMPAKDVTVIGSFTKNDDPQPDPDPEPDPEQDITKDNVVYEIEGNYVVVIQSDNASGELKIESSVVINGKTYEVTVIAKAAFEGCTGITSLEIPNTITTVGEKAFDGCTGLSLIIIGTGIKEIGRKAFANIFKQNARTRGDEDGLHFYCEAESVPNTSSEAFVETDLANATLHVPDNMVEAYKLVTPWNEFGNIVGLSDTGIKVISIDKPDALVFDMLGNRRDNIRQGINIIHTKDGKTKKVIVNNH